MSDKTETGLKGEELAADFLKQKGYTIRHRNWRSGRTEIDIVAENNEFIVFVEVKTRAADYQVHPRDAVNVPKQRTIIFAASNYIERFRVSKEARFDIITVIFDGTDLEIDHIESAYYPTM
jgi:putative endonuclease